MSDSGVQYDLDDDRMDVGDEDGNDEDVYDFEFEDEDDNEEEDDGENGDAAMETESILEHEGSSSLQNTISRQQGTSAGIGGHATSDQPAAATRRLTDASLENQYYSAKALKSQAETVPQALDEFQSMLSQIERYRSQNTSISGHDHVSGTNSKFDTWSVKALKQSTKIHVLLKGDYVSALKSFKYLLDILCKSSSIPSALVERAITNPLDLVLSSFISANDVQTPHGLEDSEKLQRIQSIQKEYVRPFFDCTRQFLQSAQTSSAISAIKEKLWMKFDLKYAKFLFRLQEYDLLQVLLATLLQAHTAAHASKANSTSRENEDLHDFAAGTNISSIAEQTKALVLLDIYALQIQLFDRTQQSQALRETYASAVRITSAIPHPRITGIIKECAGKLNMEQKCFEAARTDFYEAFKCFDEAGSPDRIQILKYLVLANIMSKSPIDPFDSQDTKPHKEEPEIISIIQIIDAYKERHVRKAEGILRKYQASLCADRFINSHLLEVLSELRKEHIVTLVTPYQRIKLSYIAAQMQFAVESVHDLIFASILEGRIVGQIDQITLELIQPQRTDKNAKRLEAFEQCALQVQTLQKALTERLQNSAITQFRG